MPSTNEDGSFDPARSKKRRRKVTTGSALKDQSQKSNRYSKDSSAGKDRHGTMKRWPVERAARLEVHSAAEAFEMIPDRELMLMAADIKTNGQRVPITVVGNFLIDGRNRLEAIKLAGVQTVRVRVLHGLSDLDIFKLSTSLNGHRRNLSKKELADAAIRLYELSDGAITWEEAAQSFGVSRRYLTEVRKPKVDKPKSTTRVDVPVEFTGTCQLLRRVASEGNTDVQREIEEAMNELHAKLESLLST